MLCSSIMYVKGYSFSLNKLIVVMQMNSVIASYIYICHEPKISFLNKILDNKML